MGDLHSSAAEGWGTGEAVEGPSDDSERGLPAGSDGGALEGCPGTIWALADPLRSIQPPAQGQHVGEDQREAADPAGWAREHRVGSVVYRRKPRAGGSGGWGGGQKGGSEDPPDHALGRPRGGFGTRIHRVTDGQGPGRADHRGSGSRIDAVRVPERVRQELRPSPSPASPPSLSPRWVAGGKADGAGRIRQWLRARAMKPVMPCRGR